MADLPDFWIQTQADIVAQTLASMNVDVIAQTLAELIQRPKYGGALRSAGVKAITASTTTTLLTITGKGMTYGGTVWTQDVTTGQQVDFVELYIDDILIAYMNFLDMEKYGITVQHSYPLYLRCYVLTEYFAVALSYGLTFESKLEIKYREMLGNSFNVHYNITYAVV